MRSRRKNIKKRPILIVLLNPPLIAKRAFKFTDLLFGGDRRIRLSPLEETIAYNQEIDDSIWFVESIDMWFYDPVLIALTDYCEDGRINWKILVRKILEEFLKREGIF